MTGKIRNPNGRLAYPWDKWFARKGIFRLTKGEDYECASHGMAAQIRTMADGRNMNVSIKIEGDSLSVHFTPKEQDVRS